MAEDQQKPAGDGPGQNAEFDASKIQDHVKKLSHKLPTGHQPSKVVAGEKDQKTTFNKSTLKPKDLLFLKSCSNSTYTVNTTCTKLLIEDCRDLVVTLNEKILTNVIELWKCENVTVNVGTAVYTVQLDICKNVKLVYEKKEDYHQVVWAGVDDLTIEFNRTPEHNLVTGLEQMKAAHSDLTINDQIDQFIIRFLADGKLTPEIIVRLANGYPTTNREADEWDEQQARKEQMTEEQLRKMLDLAPQLGINNIGKVSADGKKVKVKVNDPCPCGSGIKYKKCCERKTAGERIAKSVAAPTTALGTPLPQGGAAAIPTAKGASSDSSAPAASSSSQ
jgi:hypothetical protein